MKKDEIDHSIRIAELISKGRKNELSPDEKAELDQWLSQPGHEDLYAQINSKVIIDELVNSIASFDEHGAFLRFKHKTRRPVIRKLTRYISAAAAVLVIALGYINRESIRDWVDPVTYKKLATINGQRKTITLLDGTKIWLSPSTVISYPDRFGDTRNIKLQGEAFFEVAKDAKHPFYIESESITTKVLGTSFMVRARKEDPELAVTVVSGIVEVSRDSVHKEKLQRNQRAVLDRKAGKLVRMDYPEASKMLSLREGIYNYQGASIIEIALDMQREHNIIISLAGDLDNCTFYGSKEPQDNIYQFLQRVCLSINATLEQNGNTYIITGKGC